MTLPTMPALVAGHVTHQRTGRVRHGFRHGVYQWLVDLDDLPELPWYLRPFAGFSAADHLGDPTQSIKANVEGFLLSERIRLGERSRIVMLANARVLGHVFDPLSVFWCFDSGGALVCIVAEVHNTYGGRHAYLLRPDPSTLTTPVPDAEVAHTVPAHTRAAHAEVAHAEVAHADKVFHVSPFFDVSGRYELRFELSPQVVSSTVILRHDPTEETVAFTATFRGHPVTATRSALAAQLLRRPLMPQQVSALIRVHGSWLWLRRLPVHQPPHDPPPRDPPPDEQPSTSSVPATHPATRRHRNINPLNAHSAERN